MTTLTKTTTAKDIAEQMKKVKGQLPHHTHNIAEEEEIANIARVYATLRRPKTSGSAPYAILTAPDGTREVIISHAYAPNVRGFAQSCADRAVRKLEQIDRMRAKLEKKKAEKA